MQYKSARRAYKNNRKHTVECLENHITSFSGVSVRFTRKAYSSKEGEPALPEIVISAGDISEPTTIR